MSKTLLQYSTKPHHKPHTLPVWCEAIIQTLSVEQHFHGVEANAAAVGMLFRGVRATIKWIENMLELLLGKWFASIFDSQLILVASNFYHASRVAVAYRV